MFGRVFIYDQMDYMKVVVAEMRQIKDILTMFGVELNLEEDATTGGLEKE